MRIGIVTHNVVYGDGQGRVNYEIARSAQARGASVTLISNNVAPELLDTGVQLKRIPVLEIANLLKVREFAFKAGRVIRAQQQAFDVLCCNGTVYFGPHDLNLAHFVHGAWFASPYYPFRNSGSFYARYQRAYTSLNARWERQVYARSPAVVAVSQTVARELAQIGVGREKIKIIHNGVDVEQFRPGPGSREQLGLPPDVKLMLTVGDLRTPRKNLDTILKALVRLPQVHLAVVGDKTDSPFPGMAESLGISDRVHFLGYRRDIAELMRNVDLFVFPSRYETFGLVVLEAMASGLPIVSARTVGAAELVSADCGYVLDDPDNAHDLSLAIERIVSAPDLAQQMGKAARSQAEKYSWERMSKVYWELFQSISDGKKRGAAHAR